MDKEYERLQALRHSVGDVILGKRELTIDELQVIMKDLNRYSTLLVAVKSVVGNTIK